MGAGGGAPSGPCAGSPVYCDDFTDSAKADDYVEGDGAWTRDAGAGTYTVKCTEPGNYPRLRATLQNIATTNFDATIIGTGLGRAGFGLIFGKSDVGNPDAGSEFAVILHPTEFNGLYVKRVHPVSTPVVQDEDLGHVRYDGGLTPGPWKMRVKREGMRITVWLADAGVPTLIGDAGTLAAGPFALVGSMTIGENCGSDGAEFRLLRVDAW